MPSKDGFMVYNCFQDKEKKPRHGLYSIYTLTTKDGIKSKKSLATRDGFVLLKIATKDGFMLIIS